MNNATTFAAPRPLAPALAAFLAIAAVTAVSPGWVQSAADAVAQAAGVMARPAAEAKTTVVGVDRRNFTYLQLDETDIDGAIGAAAQLTGVSKAHLLETAMRESSMRPHAEADTSTAAGLFQFTEGTWLEMIKRYGRRYGLAAEAAQVIHDSDGDAVVHDRATEKRILALRFDARVSALMGAELARENASLLQNGLGRIARDSELYAAHVLGPANAVKLILAARRTPGRSAAAMFPKAAAANKAIFYRNGRPRSVVEVLGHMV
ncbi:MAG TPA: hypothetical protein VEA15_03760 [Caulobacteraceae bacterium]|nr:hypothetical protein [Caulobacteraceae bacterium]